MLEVGGSKPSPPTKGRAHSVVRLEGHVTPRGIDEYLAALDEQKRTSLQELRQTILGIIPNAQECISYGMPGFRLEGKVIAGFAAFKNHLSYLPHSGSVLGELTDDLAGYESTPGSLHFPIDQPLPKALVRKLIAIRLKEVRSPVSDERTPRPGKRGR
jgi:uncharacterized protein YdhG (YjbR/CyaY superfamily)